MSPARILVLVLAVGAGVSSVSRRALADEAPPSAERIKAAAEEFDRGRRAFLAKDFEQAAGHFENAFRDAPSKETLRLAIRARRDAKQPARAATLAAIAEERYADDAPTARLARETLAEAAPHLAEYVVTCSDPCALAADRRVVSQSDGVQHRIFLEPGAHDLGASFQKGGSASRHVDGKEGTSTQVSFERPAPIEPASIAPPAPAPKPSPAPAHPPSDKPLGPVVFWIGVGVTAAVGAATVASGIDTVEHPGADAVRQGCVGQGEACPLYQEGKSAETRTNVLLGATIGVAALTGVVGLFFTQWSSSSPEAPEIEVGAARLVLSPAGVRGRF